MIKWGLSQGFKDSSIHTNHSIAYTLLTNWKIKSHVHLNRSERFFFLELSCFFNDPTNVDNWISGSSAFSKFSLNIWNSRFTYCWSLAWRIFSITFLECEMSAIVWYFEHSLALPFFGIRMKIDLFQSCDHCWVFQIFWHIECSTFTASSFKIWNRQWNSLKLKDN